MEIPIVFTDRVEGQSKMNKRIVREAIWMVWWLRLQSLWAAVRARLLQDDRVGQRLRDARRPVHRGRVLAPGERIQPSATAATG